MRKYFLILVVILITKISLANGISQIIEENPNLTFAIAVKDAKTGKNIYSYYPERVLIPASVTKIFTAYAVLDYLGKDFTYKTQIAFKENQINEQGVLEGNLYIKFSGDPSLTKEDFAHLLSKLEKQGIKKINGKIIIDDTVFDQDYKAIGETWDDGKFCYAAPSSAIVINKNCLFLVLLPAKSNDSPAKIVGKSYANIINETVTKGDDECATELTEYPNNSYKFTGCLNDKSAKIPLRIAYQDPRLMIVSLVKDLLLKQNIETDNTYYFGKIEAEYPVILEHKSAPLSVLVKKMQKNSDNLMANNMLKTLGAYYYKAQGNFKNGSLALQQIISKRAGIDFSKIRIVDGAGQSRYNLIAPEHLVELLISAHSHNDIWDSFYESFSIMAVDGLLSKRLNNHKNLHGKIYAKSGTLTGVSTLAGYTETGKVFAIMLNGYVGAKANMPKLIDQILAEIEKL